MPWFLTPVLGAKIAYLLCRPCRPSKTIWWPCGRPVCSNILVFVGFSAWLNLAGKELVIFKRLVAVLLIPLHKPNACGVAVRMCADRSFKKLLRLRLAQFREEVHLVIFLWSLPGCYLKWTLSFMFWNFSSSSQPWPPSPSSWFIFMHHLLSRRSTMIFSGKELWWSIVCSVKNCCSECGLLVVCVRRAAICAAVECALELEVPEMLLVMWA